MRGLKLGILTYMFVTTLALSGCACNKAIIDLNYKFDTAEVCQNGTCKVYEIVKWDDYDNDAICIWTKDGYVIYGSMNNITLYGER